MEGTLRAAGAAGALALALGCGGGGHTLEVDVVPIVEKLGADDPDVRDRAIERLVALGPAVVPALEEALEAEPPTVRLGVVAVLGELGTPEVTEPLVEAAVRDPDDDVRYEALLTLGALGGSPAELAAERAMADTGSKKVVLGGIGACANVCRDHKGFTQLVELALRAPMPEGMVARSVIGRLLLEGESRVRVLRTVVADRTPSLLGDDTPPDVRVRAALLASDLGNAGAQDALLAAAGDGDGLLRAHAVWGLGQVGDARAVPVLAGLRETPVSPYAYDALRRIAERGVPAAQAALDAWTGDKPASAMPAPYAVF